jgi:hypothetical protein
LLNSAEVIAAIARHRGKQDIGSPPTHMKVVENVDAPEWLQILEVEPLSSGR